MQYLGITVIVLAALITAVVGLFGKLNLLYSEVSRAVYVSKHRTYGIVNSKSGTAFLKESPNPLSNTMATIINDSNVEILSKTNDGWFEVYTESGRTGYVPIKDLDIFQYEN
jgi:hypothetical protein